VDNIAHTLIGIGVARSGLSKRCGPGTTLTLAIASNLPDMDVLWALWDPMNVYLLRRTHSHALIALPVLAALLACAMRWRHPERSWKTLFGLSALGIGLHVLFDLVNSFGVVILWPFTMRRFELSSVFIVDLFVWGSMIAPLVAGFFLKTEPAKQRASQAALGALGLYLVLCVAGHARAEAQVRSRLTGPAESVRVFPEPFGPPRYRAVVRSGSEWRVFLCNVLRGAAEQKEVVPTQDDHPRVVELRATPRGKRLEWFMAAPVWTVFPDGRVQVYDLRFNSLVYERKGIFVVEFPTGDLPPVVR
jgi:inner membrane protein